MANNTIGQFIAALRKANGFTQQNVADRLNVSNKAVSRWERDECAPDLSLIPAIAEMFGVTCDELLKGERMIGGTPLERKEPKVDKQVRSLINRSLSSFKTLIWISLAVAIVGLVCMFGIAYGFYRPVIGFAVMMLFESVAFVLTAISVSRLRDVKADNEIFEMANRTQVEKFNGILGMMSFTVFFAILAVLLLSLPLILIGTGSGYINSVLSIESYMIFFIGIVLLLTLIWLKCKALYIAWITGETAVESAKIELSESRRKMSFWQIGLTLFSGLAFFLAPYFDVRPRETNPLYTAAILLGLGCLLINVISFVVFLTKEKDDRKDLILPGIRNILFIPSAYMVSLTHYVGWISTTEGATPNRYEFWETKYFGYALGLAAVVIIVFAIIELTINKNRISKTRAEKEISQ